MDTGMASLVSGAGRPHTSRYSGVSMPNASMGDASRSCIEGMRRMPTRREVAMVALEEDPSWLSRYGIAEQ